MVHFFTWRCNSCTGLAVTRSRQLSQSSSRSFVKTGLTVTSLRKELLMIIPAARLIDHTTQKCVIFNLEKDLELRETESNEQRGTENHVSPDVLSVNLVRVHLSSKIWSFCVVRDLDLLKQYNQQWWGRESCRSAWAVPSARSPQSPKQWHRTRRGRESCRISGAVPSVMTSDQTGQIVLQGCWSSLGGVVTQCPVLSRDSYW